VMMMKILDGVMKSTAVSVNSEGEKTYFHKWVILCNVQEGCLNFKERNPEKL
jgi:hypothetical protein